MYRIGFAGFKHAHIRALYALAQNSPEAVIVAAWESDPAARLAAQADGISFTHETYEGLLAEDGIDIVAIGDYYAIRGPLAIAALQAGKHVISDKPLCVSLDELSTIRQLAQDRNLKVGMMLDMRFGQIIPPIRRIFAEGKLGAVHAICFGGQHPLNYGTRPDWYFESGKHGGTINDIAIHGIDLIAYLTGLRLRRVIAARCWNAYATAVPAFKDCGQFMAEMDNGAGLMGDVSYASPDSFAYGLPFYWRFTLWCANGVLEFTAGNQDIKMALNGSNTVITVPVSEVETGNCLSSLIDDIEGRPISLNTTAVLAASQDTLTIQSAADL
ncbi:MAG: Gfo/Idh/MocA family oxidoreductase [Bacillota bacterium]|nr:Gfo/Idh/MocA family oxidoreductase [Bacillota bacterium]